SGMTSDLADIEIRAEGDLGSLPVIIAIAIIVILVLVAVLIIMIRKKRPRVTDEFYIIDEPPPENTDDPEEVEFEIEFFDGRTNYYQLLDLEDNATGPEIKRAYRKLASLYHPDRMAARGEEMELDEVADLMRDINEAKSVLLDPLRRQVYDMSLLEQEM
ncbi:MAG: DnaJ domain-containing protein, partial [Candidatus Thermoplasmatota archaeon]|nr:DnaJ domain-containing protein [Candidatus Thermoplasmatota archaeon]